MARILMAVVLGAALFALLIGSASAQAEPRLTVLDRAGDPTQSLTDGDVVRLAVELPEAVAEPTIISFYLDRNTLHLADCEVPIGQRGCATAPIDAFGWYWGHGGQVAPQRRVYAIEYELSGWVPIAAQNVAVAPRPVVLVHGFGANASSWDKYLGPSGYLALAGLPGYAVGDGQVAGALQTGNLLRPSATTHTIAQNAAVLREYIANVKAETGAERVDLIGHSMGGLISRYYIDSLMGERDVAQLIMLGTPNAGSDCALLAGSLALYLPAVLEIRSSYVQHVFNPQVTEQHGVPFYMFAGTPIRQPVLSPCTPAPHDLVVSLESAAAIPAKLVEVPILHIEQNTSEELFVDFVAPLLRQPADDFAAASEEAAPPAQAESAPVQFSRIYTGAVTAGEGNEHTIHIDADVAVASFGLYDLSRTLTVTVRGASGNVIALSPEANGLTVVDDPASLIYLGYGFENPRPGPWRVTVRAGERTPPLGAEYAIIVHYVGGAAIEAELSSYLPGVGEEVGLTAALSLGDEALAVDSARAVVRRPDGRDQSVPVATAGAGVRASWQPEQPGVYGIDVTLSSVLPDGAVVERSAYLALEAFEHLPAVRR